MAKPATFVATLTEVGNLSLEAIGEAPKDFLTDAVFDDNTGTIAEIVQRHMYVVIREAQTDYKWDCLFKRAVLTTPEDITDNDEYLWDYRFTLPDDFLTGIFHDHYDYEIEGGFIYCNFETELRFSYVRYSIDPAEWPSTMLAVVISKLSMAICMPITENQVKYEKILTEFERVVLPRAQRVDALAKKYPRNRRKTMGYARSRGRVMRYGPDDRRQY
ncbi:MAG: hypothetical protein DRP64_18710 [Verrucomicrobia bacterium]|nr:MAG: hypothetical protein DRP64_18710 [Verrucomicrobiota bacterium]